MGRQVPKDLAVIGFDDAPEAAFFCPPLSTVRQDLSQLGRSSVRELERMIEARQEEEVDIEPKTILLEPELVVRESSVRP
jgi:DNA-binding LacI/PurR family transcriptional regulator